MQKDYEAIQAPDVRVQPDTDLQQCKEVHWGIGDTIRRNSQKTWRMMVNLQLTFFHLINNKRYFMSRGGLRSIFSPPLALSHSITHNITIHMKMAYKSYLPEVNRRLVPLMQFKTFVHTISKLKNVS